MASPEHLTDSADPTILVKMRSGYAHFGYVQFLPGYCLLFADPAVRDLTDLDTAQRADFLRDMGLIGDAVMTVCKPLRMNYAMLGNSHPFLHAHVFPRYEWEPEERRTKNVWSYPEDYWSHEDHKFNEAHHGKIKTQIIEVLHDLMDKAY